MSLIASPFLSTVSIENFSLATLPHSGHLSCRRVTLYVGVRITFVTTSSFTSYSTM